MTTHLRVVFEGGVQRILVNGEPTDSRWKWKDVMGTDYSVAWENGERRYDVDIFMGDKLAARVPARSPGLDAHFDQMEAADR